MARILTLQSDCPPEEVEGMWLFRKIEEHEDQYPEMKWIFHVPNGGWRHDTVGKKLKAQGVRPGVPDYLWPLPRGIYHGCAIELKRVHGGRLEESQTAWRDWLISQGYFWALCRGAVDAWEKLLWYYRLAAVI